MLARLLLKPILAGLMLTLSTGVSWAEEEEVKGMPQLDPHVFASQLFWLALFFILVFLFLRFVGLPRVTAIIDARSKTIRGDIASAEALRTQAAEAEKTYEATMATARSQARLLLAETYEKNKATIAKETEQAIASADFEVNQALKRIEADRGQALRSVREAAEGLAADITAKLAGRVPGGDRVSFAVDKAAGEIG